MLRIHAHEPLRTFAKIGLGPVQPVSINNQVEHPHGVHDPRGRRPWSHAVLLLGTARTATPLV
jgi:hypothetical protein